MSSQRDKGDFWQQNADKLCDGAQLPVRKRTAEPIYENLNEALKKMNQRELGWSGKCLKLNEPEINRSW